MYAHYLKRVFDLLLVVFIFPLLLLVLLPISCLIWLEDKGPVFYTANRLGQHGKPFRMYKFRSMKVNAPDYRNPDGSTVSPADDPRVTRVGKLLRRTSLDELPQILNVIQGNMSIVGPRPVMADFDITQLAEELQDRFMVKPGITGYSQAYYRNGIQQTETFRNDSYYVRNVHFQLDLKILLKTAETVLLRRNVYKDDPVAIMTEENLIRKK